MPQCAVCRGDYQAAASFCPTCGAPLSTLAARMRDEPPHRVVVLPESPAVDQPEPDRAIGTDDRH
jgi:predicted amidophosphoribosyltransferase